jgi:hypothetical protein
MSLDRISGPEVVHRVERDESAQEFGKKNRDERNNRKRRPTEAADLDTPQDVVDLSADYQSEASAPVPTLPPAPPVPARGVPVRVPDASAEPSPDRHIDIKV